MREPRPIADWLEVYVADADPIMALDIYARELSEVASVTIRPGMADIWALLRAKGLGLAICSNLASSFGLAVRRALPDPPDVAVFSYAVGAIKPEPEIYAQLAEGWMSEQNRNAFPIQSAQIRGLGQNSIAANIGYLLSCRGLRLSKSFVVIERNYDESSVFRIIEINRVRFRCGHRYSRLWT